MKMIKGNEKSLALALLVASVGGETGCAPASPEEMREAEQLLATGFGGPDPRFLSPWASPGDVDVCFVAPTGQEGHADYLAAKPVVRSTIEDTWEASTGLTFDFHGNCPATIDAEWLSIYLDINAGGGGEGAFAGKGARLSPQARFENRTDIQVYMGASSANSVLPVLTAHEVGHTLGFYHEMERIENDGDCLDGAGNPIVGTNAYGHFTPYDENSVMLWSYCVTPAPNRTNEHPISKLDALGAEMLYPKADPLPVACAERCMLSGTGVILREDGTAVNSWTARGALDWWDTDLSWGINSTIVSVGAEFDAAEVGEGEHELDYWAVAKLNGDTITGEGLVEVSDSKWTAVAMAAL